MASSACRFTLFLQVLIALLLAIPYPCVGSVLIERDKKAKDAVVIKIENLKSASYKAQASAKSLNVVLSY